MTQINRGLAEQATNLATAIPVPSEIGTSPGESRQRKLLKFATEVELFMNLDGDAFAAIPQGAFLDNVPLREKRFSNYLNYEFYKREGIPAGATAVSDVIGTLEAIAAQECKKYSDLYVRIGELHGKLYIDLANDARDVIEISRDGWRKVSSSP